MIGGEHHEPLTGALLRDWAKGDFTLKLTAWVTSLGGKFFRREELDVKIAEAAQDILAKGQDIRPLFNGVIRTHRWDDIDAPATIANPRWAWLVEPYPPLERVNLVGPKGGDRGHYALGWRYRTCLNNLPAGSWVELTKQEGIGAFRNNTVSPETPNGLHAWLWGFSHVVVLHCSLESLHDVIHHDELFGDIIAGMFNNMLTRLELAPQAPEAATPAPTYNPQLARQQASMVERIKGRREELAAKIQSRENAIKEYQAEIDAYKRLLARPAPVPNLSDCLKAIVDKGICSGIKQDPRGLWFLFDEVHAVVSAELAQKGSNHTGTPVVPGIYKIAPVVVHLPWDVSGAGWVCGTPEGGTHPHPHANSSGAFVRPCLGSVTGTLGPKGITNGNWFAQLWDEDPIKWAETIHAFMRQTNFEVNPTHYRGIWACGTLVTSHEPGAKLRVKKLPTPKLTVTRTVAATAVEAEF